MAHTNVADRITMRRAELESSSEHLKARWGAGMLGFILASIALVMATLYLSQL